MGRIVGFEPWLSGLVLDPVLSGLVYRAWGRICWGWFARFGFVPAGFGFAWFTGFGSGVGSDLDLLGLQGLDCRVGTLMLAKIGWLPQLGVMDVFCGLCTKGVCGLGFVILKTLIFQRF